MVTRDDGTRPTNTSPVIILSYSAARIVELERRYNVSLCQRNYRYMASEATARYSWRTVSKAVAWASTRLLRAKRFGVSMVMSNGSDAPSQSGPRASPSYTALRPTSDRVLRLWGFISQSYGPQRREFASTA